MNIFKLLNGAKFDHDQIKEKNVIRIEIFNFFVSDHLKSFLGRVIVFISICVYYSHISLSLFECTSLSLAY